MGNVGVASALAGAGQTVFPNERTHAAIVGGCARAGAETMVDRHGDVEHLVWCVGRTGGRGGVIVTDSVFSMDGDVAPLEDIVEVARQAKLRVVVDEAHGTGCVGPGGRGAVVEAGLEGEVDVVIGTLG